MPFPGIKRATLAAIAFLLSLELSQAKVAELGYVSGQSDSNYALAQRVPVVFLSVRNDSAEKDSLSDQCICLGPKPQRRNGAEPNRRPNFLSNSVGTGAGG